MGSMNSEETVEAVENYMKILSGLDRQTAIFALVFLVLGFVMVRLVLRVEKKALESSRALPPSTHAMIRTLSRVMLDFVVIITVANYVGIPVSSFVAVLSIVGIAITLAVQGLLGNLVGGFIILGAKPFEVGQFVETGGISGTVEQIGMVYTRLLAADGRRVYLPNSTLYTSQVINYSQYGKRRVTAVISADYACSPEKVKDAVRLAISRVEGIDMTREPLIFLENFADSGITYNIHVWCNAADFLSVKYALNEQLWYAFRESGVEIPFPHMQILSDKG